MLWISEERAMCYAGEHVKVRSTADKSILFAGIIRGLKFTFNFSSENTKENNTVECSIRGLAECKYYPFNILGSTTAECQGQYERVFEDKSADYAPDNFSQHTFSFEKANGEVLFTAKLLKNMPADWFETPGGGRRRRPPYDLRFNEKTQGIGYADNMYLDPIKQLIAAGTKCNGDVRLSCDLRNWHYSLEEHIAIGRLNYPDGRMLVVKDADENIYPQPNKIFRSGCIVRDYVSVK